jgi:cyclophilin family peptidyl-prolyl cis-trans isomerase
VSKANKRERQRLNREARREYEETLAKRRRRMKALRGFAIVAVPVIAIGVILSLTNSGGDDDKKSASTTPTTYKSAPPMTIDPAATYTATIATSEGNISMSLDAAAAPTSVNNFVFLARQGFYDGLDFHRIAKDFVIQGGDPKGNGTGGPGYKVQAELPANGYTAGSVAWAKGGDEPAGTAGSQFFIVTTDNGALGLGGPPYQYGIIGHVTQGFDVVQKIAGYAPATGDGAPTKKVTIKKVAIDEQPPSTTPAS